MPRYSKYSCIYIYIFYRSNLLFLEWHLTKTFSKVVTLLDGRCSLDLKGAVYVVSFNGRTFRYTPVI